jgi:hypothetical protein
MGAIITGVVKVMHEIVYSCLDASGTGWTLADDMLPAEVISEVHVVLFIVGKAGTKTLEAIANIPGHDHQCRSKSSRLHAGFCRREYSHQGYRR